jgi:hypothetical protein
MQVREYMVPALQALHKESMIFFHRKISLFKNPFIPVLSPPASVSGVLTSLFETPICFQQMDVEGVGALCVTWHRGLPAWAVHMYVLHVLIKLKAMIF